MLLEDFRGESLNRILPHQSLDLQAVLQLVIHLAEILEHVHLAHIIHKDINSSNIVWNPATHQFKLNFQHNLFCR
ncbi:hypothetical protein CSA56_07150 [candidate division KSB3 bacterium]|uniref:Protein kinase domain-containing protein n=1 Tax=candidate division KSB3 bacterium TaxID=2044937 RepID=A0A2G6KG71_9BACT|nr:MAG: hypothetical protein CSA56_07150 [candidate division KSB3 bacterium]